MPEADSRHDSPTLRIFRGREAPDLNETQKMTLAGLTPIIESGVARWVGAGVTVGATIGGNDGVGAGVGVAVPRNTSSSGP